MLDQQLKILSSDSKKPMEGPLSAGRGNIKRKNNLRSQTFRGLVGQFVT